MVKLIKEVTAVELAGINAKGFNLINLIADSLSATEVNSKELFSTYHPILGISPNYKKGGAPNITLFCSQVYELAVADNRLQDEKGAFRPYSVASAHHKDKYANVMKALETWIKRNSDSLFNVIEEVEELNAETGELEKKQVKIPLFETVAKEEEEKEIKAVMSAMALIFGAKCIDDTFKAVLKPTFDAITAGLVPSAEILEKARKEKIAALEAASKPADVVEEVVNG